MTVEQLVKILDATVINEADFSRQVADGYAGDLLSFVMGNAPSDTAWFTIMTNVNVCAVATLTDVAVIVICDGCKADDNLVAKSQMQKVNVISTKLDVYHAIATVEKHKLN